MKQYGLILSEIKTKEQGVEHILGALGVDGSVINPQGDWSQYLPTKEPQNKRGIETQSCTCYGTLNALETLFKFKGIEANYSDRYLAIMADVDPYRGADPHQVCEVLRLKSGCLNEDRLPFSDDLTTVEQFYQPKPMSPSLIDEAHEWYKAQGVRHIWIFQGGTPQEKREKLKEALTKGTVCVSVSAWYFDKRYYKPTGVTDNHWCQLVAVKDDHYLIFDSYDGFLKELDPLYDFAIAKVFYLTPGLKEQVTFFSLIVDLWKRVAQLFLLKELKQPMIEPIIPIDQADPKPVEIKPKPMIDESLIEEWAEAMKKQEGWFPGSRSQRLCNPGNLRFTVLTESLGAIGHDSDNFCRFPNEGVGFRALCDFLTLAAQDQLKDYHDKRTLRLFIRKYANPPNDNYALNVAKDLQVDVDGDISTLL